MRGMAFLFPVMIFVQSGLSLGIYWLGSKLVNNIAIPLSGSISEIVTAIGERADLLGDVVAFNSYALYVVCLLYFCLQFLCFCQGPRFLQKAIMFSDTIKNNVAFGEGSETISKVDIERAVNIAQGTEFVSKLKNGMESRIAQGGTNISGGQKQRLAIARAIARKPEILVFDDSFSALDYKTDQLLRRTISEELEDTTCLIVAQRIGTIRHADKIVVLDEGKVAGMGTHEELIEICPVYQEFERMQLRRIFRNRFNQESLTF